MKITQLIKGTHVVEAAGAAGANIVDHTGSVNLIQHLGSNILIDCGGRGRLPEIQTKLAELGATPETVDYVILTHFHLDHSFNISAFPNARVIGWNHEWNSGSTFRFDDIKKWQVLSGISLLPTAGHTPEHISVIAIDNDGKKVVLAGDAINKKYVETKIISAYASDAAAYAKNADAILSMADEIILGHGETIVLNKTK